MVGGQLPVYANTLHRCQCVHVSGGANMSGVPMSISGVSMSMSVVVSTCLVSLSLARPHWPWPGRKKPTIALEKRIQGGTWKTGQPIVRTAFRAQWVDKIQSTMNLEKSARNRCRKAKRRSNFCLMLSLEPGVLFKFVRSEFGNFVMSDANYWSR